MSAGNSLLVDVLLEPTRALGRTEADWDLLIRQARSAQLLPRLAVALDRAGVRGQVPQRPADHLDAALLAQQRQRQALRWEVDRLAEALAARGVPLVLLKGAAYEMSHLPPSESRLCNDIDILVTRTDLRDAELALLMHGWTTVPLDAYDLRYYRKWMHELPPMRHRTRHSVVDIHHNLVPDTARIHPDPEALLAGVVSCPGRPDVKVLGPDDLILHSAVHLFNDGEFDHGLRDLFDIADLVGHFIQDEADWRRLLARARELELARPLFYAVRYMRLTLGSDVPAFVADELPGGAPPGPARPALDAIFLRGLRPDHSSCRDTATSLARFMLFVRGHYLRMPLHLLLPHLARKALLRNQSHGAA